MVDFNALIVWKTLIDICFSIKSSLWALTAAYTKFRRMIWSMIWAVACGHRSRSPMCTVTSSKRRETTGEKLKAFNFVIPEWVEPLCWSAVLVTTAMTHPPPSSFPVLPATFAPPLFNEGLRVSRWKNCGIKDVCRLVLDHFDGLMRLIIFHWNKKVNSFAKFPYLFCRPIFPCRILCRRGAFGHPWLRCIQWWRQGSPRQGVIVPRQGGWSKCM